MGKLNWFHSKMVLGIYIEKENFLGSVKTTVGLEKKT